MRRSVLGIALTCWRLALLAVPMIGTGCERDASGESRAYAALPGVVSAHQAPTAALDSDSSSEAMRGSATGTDLPRDYPAAPLLDPSERDLPVAGSLRIVSAAPSVTEILAALGLRAAIVGRTRYCTHPPGIEEIPSFGALLDVSSETLLALRPDMVIISGRSRSIADRLAPLKIRVESVPDDSLDDIFTAIRRMGDLCGRPKSARLLCESLREDLAGVTRRLGGGRSLRVLIATGPLPNPPRAPFVAGPGSFYHELIELAGHRTALPPDAAAFAELSLESLLAINPDVILELAPDAHSSDARSALTRWGMVGPLDAVKRGRVIAIAGPETFVPGPRIARVYAGMLAQLSPFAKP